MRQLRVDLVVRATRAFLALPWSQDTVLRIAIFSFAAGLTTASLLPPVHAQDSVVARINGVEIRQSEIALLSGDPDVAVPQALSAEEKRDYLVNYAADLILMEKAAEQQGIMNSNELKQRLALSRRKLAAQLLMQSIATKASTPAELEKAYAEVTKQVDKVDEIHARQIVLRTESEARAVLKELNDGKDFGDLAKARSIDPGASQAGDLGYFTKDQLSPEFAEVAFKLSKGQMSDPIRTEAGWHILKIEDKRKKIIGSLDDMKEELRLYLTRKAQLEFMAKVRETANAELVR
ncbi:peptidyl-prolyl cis-trans isomerase C [Bradyrhizobium japonicum]